MKVNLIYAVNSQGAIGYKGEHDLAWYSPRDLAHFAKLTKGHTVLMGRNTFNSMGLLSKRFHLVLTSSKLELNKHRDNIYCSSTLKDLLIKAKKIKTEELFIIGGYKLLNDTMFIADRIYRTIVPADDLLGELAIVKDIPEDTFELVKETKGRSGLIFQTFERKQ